MRPGRLVLSVVVVAWSSSAGSAGAQRVTPDTIPLSLPDAIRRATTESEEIRLTGAQLRTAETAVTSARSRLFPQIGADLAYVRTLENPYSPGSRAFQLPVSQRFQPDTTAPLEQRVRYLEQHAPEAGLQAIIDVFQRLPLGRDHVYFVSVNASQVLFAGGGVRAGIRLAQREREAAEFAFTEQRAGLELQVTQAYYQSLLAQELLGIAVAALEQADRFLADQRLRLEAGRTSELEVLQAEVSRDNLQPQLVQARNATRLAQLDLKRLVNLPLERPVRLVTPLAVPSAAELADTGVSPAFRTAQRAALEAAERQVGAREQQVAVARAAFFPSVALRSTFGLQIAPPGMFNFRSAIPQNNWTVSFGVQVPVFQGLSRVAAFRSAQLGLEQSRLELAQLSELVRLEYEQARGEKEEARSAIAARQRTVTIAERVYDLVVLRYEQGLATQLEVSDARLDLLQARSNLALAIADFHTAETRRPSSESAVTGASQQLPAAGPQDASSGGTGGGTTTASIPRIGP